MSSKWELRSAFLIIAALASVAAAETQIGVPLGPQISEAFGATETYGQTVVVPHADYQLDSFSFMVRGRVSFDFRAYAMQWDGTKATGVPLFQSEVRTITITNDFIPQAFSFSPVELVPDSQCVLFFNVRDLNYNAGTSRAQFAGVGNDPYPAGRFVYTNTDVTLPAWNITQAPDFDTSFSAHFVPEPSLGAVVAGIAFVAARRRSKP